MFKVIRRSCVTCIFRKSSMLANELPYLVQLALDKDTFRICHNHERACCAGFWARYKTQFQMGQIALRLNLVTFVEPVETEMGAFIKAEQK